MRGELVVILNTQGTYGDAAGLTTEEACTEVLAGSRAAAGKQLPCSAGRFAPRNGSSFCDACTGEHTTALFTYTGLRCCYLSSYMYRWKVPESRGAEGLRRVPTRQVLALTQVIVEPRSSLVYARLHAYMSPRSSARTCHPPIPPHHIRRNRTRPRPHRTTSFDPTAPHLTTPNPTSLHSPNHKPPQPPALWCHSAQFLPADQRGPGKVPRAHKQCP